MSEIPSHIAASGAQAGMTAQQVARGRDAARADATRAGADPNRAVDKADEVIATDDKDTEVYSDAEGTGSQGREPDVQSEEQQAADGPPPQGISRDDDGQLHLDIEA